jgi:hypothetical protein
MWADRGIEHGPAAARSDNVKTSGPISKSAGQAHDYEKCGQDMEFHRLLKLASGGLTRMRAATVRPLNCFTGGARK